MGPGVSLRGARRICGRSVCGFLREKCDRWIGDVGAHRTVGGKSARRTHEAAAMIRAVLIVNNHGKPRLTKFFEHYVREEREKARSGRKRARARERASDGGRGARECARE